MTPVEIGVIGIVALLALMFIGVPVGFAMALMGFVGFIFIRGSGAAINMMGQVPYSTVASYIFSVLPLFVLMGEFGSISEMVPDAYRTFHKWLGRLPGGLAMATVGGCAGFAAVCGSSSATAATMTRIALPEMRQYKYNDGLATACLAAGGTLGIMIPPSLPFVLYGMVAEESVGKLFLAGILPGILQAVSYILIIYVVCRRNSSMGPAGPAYSWRKKIIAFKDVIALAVLFLLVMGGIWFGIFTPTEAGSIGAFGAFIFVLLRKRASKKNLVSSFMNMIETTGMAIGILIGAMIFNYFMAVSRLPAELSGLITSVSIPPVGVLVFMLLVYLILGCFMSSFALLLLVAPIFIPIVSSFGWDLLWFGVLTVRLMEIGQITPPVGIDVFVVTGMSGVPLSTVFKGIVPFLIADGVNVVILVAIPAISLFLPHTMMST